MTERRSWTKEEDQTLKYLKEDKKMAKWSQIALRMANQFGLQGRNQKQCRERYHNHLDQNITLEKLADKEEELLFESHDQIGNKWSLIAIKFKGRTDNYLKNHFYSKLRSAIRRINRLIKENWKKNSSTFTLNIVYKIVEMSDQNCQLNVGLTEKETFFFILKNQILQFGGAKLTKDYFQSIHQDDQVQYLIVKLKKFERIYAFAKGRQNKQVKEERQCQSQHTLSKSLSENEGQNKKLFKVFQQDQEPLKRQTYGTQCLIRSQSQLKLKINSTSSIEAELIFEKIVFMKNKSIDQMNEQNICEDSQENLMNDLLKDEDIKLPTFRRRGSNYSSDSSFHLNDDSFQLRDSRNFLEMKSFDSMLSIDSALFQ